MEQQICCMCTENIDLERGYVYTDNRYAHITCYGDAMYNFGREAAKPRLDPQRYTKAVKLTGQKRLS